MRIAACSLRAWVRRPGISAEGAHALSQFCRDSCPGPLMSWPPVRPRRPCFDESVTHRAGWPRCPGRPVPSSGPMGLIAGLRRGRSAGAGANSAPAATMDDRLRMESCSAAKRHSGPAKRAADLGTDAGPEDDRIRVSLPAGTPHNGSSVISATPPDGAVAMSTDLQGRHTAWSRDRTMRGPRIVGARGADMSLRRLPVAGSAGGI